MACRMSMGQHNESLCMSRPCVALRYNFGLLDGQLGLLSVVTSTGRAQLCM